MEVALNWINGEWIDSSIHKDSINPATGEFIGKYADGGELEAKLAIDAAKRAFNKTDWRQNRHPRYKVIREAEFEFSLVSPKLRYFAAQTLTYFGRALETKPG